MAVTVTKSDISGSSLTLAYKDFNKDQAVRRFYVEAATTDTKVDVLNAIYASIGTLHNTLTDLPLQTINVTRIGIGTWMATAIYNRSAASGLPQSNTLLAETSERFEYTSVVATNVGLFNSPSAYENGLPAGPINMPSSALYNPFARNLIVRRKVPVPVSRVRIPFDRGVHPDINYANLLGTINANNVALFGAQFLCKRYELLFEGIECRSVATALGTRYGGYYIFQRRMSGHAKQTEYFASSGPGVRAKWKWGWELNHIATDWPPSFT